MNDWLEKITQALTSEPQDLKQLMDILKEAAQNKLINTNALKMIEGVLEVQELQVHDVMIPRSQMVVIKNNTSCSDIIKIVTTSGHSRFPVIGENKDEVLGILLAKDLLDKQFDLKNILRQAEFIPESKRLDKLLQDFKASRHHMAIVIDEYGGVTGLVTIEDVLEQIVGDIEDEYDINADDLIKKYNNNDDNNNYYIKALTPLDDFNNYFKTSFDDKNIETIGGLIMREFGHLPKRGESVELGNFKFKVLRADNRRIYLLQAINMTNNTQ